MRPTTLALFLLAPLALPVACTAPVATEHVLRESTPEALCSIARLEDARTLGPRSELQAYLLAQDPAVRARAATAVGRLREPVGGRAATDALADLLADPEEGVRAAAAFAVGMRGDVAPGTALMRRAVGQRADRSALVRARCLEAASKLGEPAPIEDYLTALADPAPEVRLEAAAGTARWRTDSESAGEVDAALAAFVLAETDLAARTYGLFALERRKATAGREAFLKSARAGDPDERIFAVRGLAALAGDAVVDEALAAAVRDADWRVAVEALRGLAKTSAPAGLEAVAACVTHASHHVRAAAVEAATAQAAALGPLLRADGQRAPAFQGLLADLSPAVRAAAIANPLIGNTLLARSLAAGDVSPHVRAAAVQAHARFAAAAGTANPLRLAQGSAMAPGEQDLLVRGAEIEALALGPKEEATRALVARLAESDNGLRLAAATALLEQAAPRVDVVELERCYATSTGEIGTEVRFNLLRLAAKVGGEGARALLKRGLDDEDAFVRRTAREELARLTGAPVPWVDRPLPAVELGFPGEGPLADPRPRVVIATDKGELEFVLFADEAPQHVQNFLKHAEAYRGTTFHRVVSDFVVQGGDARGDGNGGSSWRGDALRLEVTPRKFVRGSLGMPRNEDPDSGGSQLFVTHRMTPHLDGRYTIFGELVQGFDVLDRLDLGDTIREVRAPVADSARTPDRR